MTGITVTLYDNIQVGENWLHEPIYQTVSEDVDNVLVAPMSDQEVLETYNLTGRKGIYQLAIPKGDTHDWTAGKRVDFFDKSWRIIGYPQEGIDHLIPLAWNKKVRVEIYEQAQESEE